MFAAFQGSGILLHFLVCWMVVPVSIAMGTLLPPVESNVRLSDILRQFELADFVLHVDESRMNFISVLGGVRSTVNPVTIYKYTDEEYDFQRPPVSECVHFVAQQDHAAFLKHYSHIESNVQDTDIVIFISARAGETKNYTALYSSGVDNAKMAYYLNTTHAYAIYFYNSDQAAPDVRLVPRSKDDVPELSFRNEFKNFRGFPLKIGYTNCRPFVYRHELYLQGVEFKVMEMVIALLNFTPQFEDYSKKIDGRLTLIKDVNKSILHCAIGCLSNNIKRNQMVSFSTMLQSEPHIVVYSTGLKYVALPIQLLFKPLHEYVWICCICTLIFVSVAVKLLIVFERKDISVNPVLLPISILLEQSIAIPPKSNALRFGLVTWLLVGFALSSSYKSKLTSALIMPASREPDVISQLVAGGYHFISPAEDSTFIVELLQLSNDNEEKYLGRNLEDTKDVCESLMRAVNEMSVVLEEQTVLRYKVWNYCHLNLTLKEMFGLRRLEHPITINGHVWAMPKAAPYKDRISHTLEVLKSVGLVQKWYQSYNISRRLSVSNSVRQRGDTEPLEPHDLLAAFVVLGIGCLFGTLIFLFECIVNVDQSVTKPTRPTTNRRVVNFA